MKIETEKKTRLYVTLIWQRESNRQIDKNKTATGILEKEKKPNMLKTKQNQESVYKTK